MSRLFHRPESRATRIRLESAIVGRGVPGRVPASAKSFPEAAREQRCCVTTRSVRVNRNRAPDRVCYSSGSLREFLNQRRGRADAGQRKRDDTRRRRARVIASGSAARARAEDPLAGRLDDSPRQSHPSEGRRPEGRRPSGVIGVDRHADDGALLRCAPADRPRRGQAARQPGVSRHPVSVRAADPREARTVPGLRRRPVLSLAHQRRRRCRFLDRVGRPRRRHDELRGARPGVSPRQAAGRRRPRRPAG